MKRKPDRGHCLGCDLAAVLARWEPVTENAAMIDILIDVLGAVIVGSALPGHVHDLAKTCGTHLGLAVLAHEQMLAMDDASPHQAGNA